MAEAPPPREAGRARRTPSAKAAQPRRLDAESSLGDVEEEVPFMRQPPPARASVKLAKAAPPPPAPRKPSEYAELDEAFAREMGFLDEANTRKRSASSGVTSVWIPPDPDEALPERLTPEDIQKVVVAQQPAIVSCFRRHQDSLVGVSGGKFVVRWFVHPSGSTYGILMETQALRGTPLATCIEGLARGWRFPRHRIKQQEPIRFPFTF